MGKYVIFIPAQISHWNMFLPLVEPLREKGIKSKFVNLEGFVWFNTLPDDSRLSGIEIWTPQLKNKGKRKKRLETFLITYSSLLPQWREFLSKSGGGALVNGQDQQILIRLLYDEGKKYGYKRIVFQDGYFNPVPLPWGWDVDPAMRQLRNRFLLKTPFHRFVSLSFGSASEYLGLYGAAVLEKHVRAGVLKEKKSKIIGSPRHAIFRQRVKNLMSSGRSLDINFLFLPRTFRREGKKFYKDQYKALEWMLSVIRDIQIKSAKRCILNIKVKYESDIGADYFRAIADHNKDIKFWAGYDCFEKLLADANIVFTTGSTSALEAAVCEKPVVQVMPDNLYRENIAIPDLPVAKATNEVNDLVAAALKDGEFFCQTYQKNAYKQLADADPNWDSISECVDWLMSIMGSRRSECEAE